MELSEKTQNFLKNLLAVKFNEVDLSTEWYTGEAKELIEVAKELGFIELAKDFEISLKLELTNN